jgi:[acyl-carrier-protein] S-malonyltransferase
MTREASVVEPAAWIDGEPVPSAMVAAELARVRAGPYARWLPDDGTAEGRQLRREITQRVLLRMVLERERAAIADAPEDGAAHIRPDPALLGSAVADVLATSVAAREVFAVVTAAVAVSESEVRAVHAGERGRHRRTAEWLLRQAFHPSDPSRLPGQLPAMPPSRITSQALLPEVRAALADAAAGTVVGPVRSSLGWHLVQVDEVLPPGPLRYADVQAEIAATLLDRRRQRVFVRWLDRRYAESVRLAPGYEHPADPRQPDATHRH